MSAYTLGAAINGVNAALITIEVELSSQAGVSVTGFPPAVIKERIDHVVASIENCGYRLSGPKITVHLSPAAIDQDVSAFDLPIALCLLAATGKVRFRSDLLEYLVMGELTEDGRIASIDGILPMAIEARKQQCEGFILPTANAMEASIVNKLAIYGVTTLNDAVRFLNGEEVIEPTVTDTRDLFFSSINDYETDFSQVHGVDGSKRALEIAAAGGHNVILIGPPDAGQTSLAKRLPSILPPLTLQEALETTKVYSVAGKLKAHSTLIAHRPYRSPHHSFSAVELLGGGVIPQPGESSLAHNGVLLLDELLEFEDTTLEALRQPLEEHVSLATNVTYPANFMLAASMSPCPCGYHNHPDIKCSCDPAVVRQYLDQVNQLILDHIDLHVEVVPTTSNQGFLTREPESSRQIRERVVKAREWQHKRFADSPKISTNAMIPDELTQDICVINGAGKVLLKRIMEQSGLPTRTYNRVLRIARTIADLAATDDIRIEHLAEAIRYRSLDQKH